MNGEIYVNCPLANNIYFRKQLGIYVENDCENPPNPLLLRGDTAER